MNNYLKLLSLFVIILCSRGLFAMELGNVGTDPEIDKLHNDIARLESEVKFLDDKIKILDGKTSSDETLLNKKIEISAVNALDLILPCKTKVIDSVARYMGETFTITDVNATKGFAFNTRKKQSILHWIFKGGLYKEDGKYHFSESLHDPLDMEFQHMNEATLRSLYALNAWGAVLDATDHKDNTGLHYAAKKIYCNAVEFLCKNGSNPNIQNMRGNIPLLCLVNKHYKMITHAKTCVENLLSVNSNLDLENNKELSVRKRVAQIQNELYPGSRFSLFKPKQCSLSILIDSYEKNSLEWQSTDLSA